MQGSRLGLNPLGEEEGGVANIFYDTLYVVLWAFYPPLIGPAEPTAQYFLERIRRTERISIVAGLHRALERIKWVQFYAHLLMTPSPHPSRKVELKLKTRKVKRKVRVPSLEEGRPSTFLTIWVWVEITEGRKFLKLRLSQHFCYFVAWGPGFRELWYMRPH